MIHSVESWYYKGYLIAHMFDTGAYYWEVDTPEKKVLGEYNTVDEAYAAVDAVV